jgi:hypothetical protein
MHAHLDSNTIWHIVFYHKTIYTGSSKHQNDSLCRKWRDAMVPLFDELNIDLAFQGHSHVYEVIGPVKNKQLVQGAVSHVDSILPPNVSFENVTGKSGGIFNVRKGTLYFLNNTSGNKRYIPTPLNSMIDSANSGVPDYPSLFTGMFGQPGNPTYSHVAVNSNDIVITTYEVYKKANGQLHHVGLDTIKIVKYCEPNTQSIVTYSNTQTFTNANLSVGVEMRIKNNATVTFKNSTLRFYSGARVIIEAGSKLVIDNTLLTNSCPDRMWSGILVAGNSFLSQTPQNQGSIELKNGAMVENARNAISTRGLKPNGDTDWYSFGGIIKADNVTFRNNRRSVEFMEYPPNGTSPVPQNVSYFNNCTFTVNNNNLFASNNTSLGAHITMWAVNGVTITGCEFLNDITTIKDRKYAIYTEDAGYTVDETCSAYNNNCVCTSNLKHSSFNGFNKAIESVHFNKPYAIKIDRSIFESNNYGIRLLGHNNIQISRSNLTLAAKQTGIYLDECTGYRVEANKIHSSSATKTTGIHINRAGTDENKIYNDTVYNTYNGIYVTEFLNTISHQRVLPATGLQLLRNVFSDNTNDINVEAPGVIRLSQGSSNCGADNLFSLVASYNFLTSNSNQQVNYYYDHGVPRKEPVYRSSLVSLFSSSFLSCTTSSFCDHIINTKSASSETPLAEYRALHQQYDKMLTYFYEAGYDKILTNYYHGIIENEELLNEALLYLEALNQLTQSMAEISVEALFALKMDSLIDLNQIKEWYDEIYTLSAKYSLAETYYQLGKFNEGLRTLHLIPEMYNLTEEEQTEHINYVSLYTFKNRIKESGRTIAELNEAEIDEMLYYANASNGLSSVMARGILCFFYEICIEDEMINAESSISAVLNNQRQHFDYAQCPNAESDNGSYGLTIYPNPGKDYITVVSEVDNGYFELRDGSGMVLKSVILHQGSNIINTSSLKHGIYIYKAIIGEHVVSGKWMKI